MRLQNIKAISHPLGNRIDLQWLNPHPDEYPGILVVRQETTHPIIPRPENLVLDSNAFLFSIDLSFQNDLDNGVLSSNLRQKFIDESEIFLSNNAIVAVKEPGNKWQVSDSTQRYIIRKKNGLHIVK